MFRIVTDFVDKPRFLLLCDDHRCGACATGEMPKDVPADQRNQVVPGFVAEAVKVGWVIGIDRHLCPQHVQRIAEGRRLIEIPQFSLKN